MDAKDWERIRNNAGHRLQVLCQMRNNDLVLLHDIQSVKGWQRHHENREREARQAVMAECRLGRLIDEIVFLSEAFGFNEENLPAMKEPPMVLLARQLEVAPMPKGPPR